MEYALGQNTAYPGCANDLINYCGEVFCATHTQVYGAKCWIFNCNEVKVKDTQACVQHQQQWKTYVAQHKGKFEGGFHRITQRPTENLPWVADREQINQLHDEEMEEHVQKNFLKLLAFIVL